MNLQVSSRLRAVVLLEHELTSSRQEVLRSSHFQLLSFAKKAARIAHSLRYRLQFGRASEKMAVRVRYLFYGPPRFCLVWGHAYSWGFAMFRETVLGIFCAYVVLMTSAANAVDRFWIDTGGGFNNWNDASNWNPNTGFAQAGDNAFFDQDASYFVIVQSPSAADNVTFSDGTVTLGGGTLNIGGATLIDDPNATALANGATVVSSGPIWDSAADITVGDLGFGELTVDSSGSLTGHSIVIGDDPNSEGEVNVVGAGSALRSDGLTASQGIFIGNAGKGTLNITGGAIAETNIADNSGSIADLELGVQAGAMGALLIDGTGSTVTAEDMFVGRAGVGLITVSNGGLLDQSISITPDAILGLDPNSPSSSGTVTVTGDNSTWNMHDGTIGRSGTGMVTIEAGGNANASGLMTLGDDPNSSGSVTVTGAGTSEDSLLAVTGILTVGNSGHGTLDVEAGGDVTVGDDLRVGGLASSSLEHTVTVTGAGSRIDVIDRIELGWNSDSSLEVLAGGVVTALDTITIGEIDNISAQLTIDGSGSHVSTGAWLTIGNEGYGTLDVTNGGTAQAAFMQIGDSDDDDDGEGEGVVTVNGATSRIDVTTSSFFIGGSTNENGGTGSLTIENGALVRSDGVIIGSGEDNLFDGEGTLTVTGAGSKLDAKFYGTNILLVGEEGGGTLNVNSGGAVETAQLVVGLEAGSETASVTLDGSGTTMDIDSTVIIGDGRVGTLVVSGGAVLTSGTDNNSNATIGSDSTADGASVTVTGAGSVWDHQGTAGASQRIRIGSSGGADANGQRSLLSVLDGGKVLSHDLLVADGSTSGAGEMVIDGMADPNNVSTVSANGFMVIGDDSVGRLTVSGGGLLESTNPASSLDIGGTSNGAGSATVTGAGSTITSAFRFAVGRSSNGSLTISEGGTVTNADEGIISRDLGSTSSVSIISTTENPSTWNNNTSLYVGGDAGGAGGTATLDVFTGGVVNVANTMRVWGGGTVTLDGGTIAMSALDVIQIGDFNFVTGTVRFTGDQTLDDTPGAKLDELFGDVPVHTLEANQHLQVAANANLLGNLRMNAASASFSVGTTSDLSKLDWDAGTLNITAQSLTVGGSGLLGPSVIVDQNQGLNVTDPNSSVTVDAGSGLNVIRGQLGTTSTTNNGLILISNTTAVDFDLDDNGLGLTNNEDLVAIDATIAGDVVNNGAIELVGTVDFSDSVTLAASGTLGIDISGLADFDRLAASGSVSLGGTLDVDLNNGFTPTAGDSFGIVFANGGFGGTFDTLDLPDLSGLGLDWELNPGGSTLFLNVVSSLAGDFDGNGEVNGFDFLAWQRGESPNPLSQTDLNDWESNYGAPALQAAVTSAVPEPATLLMMLVAIPFTLIAPRSRG